jgi:hypothetical protein
MHLFVLNVPYHKRYKKRVKHTQGFSEKGNYDHLKSKWPPSLPDSVSEKTNKILSRDIRDEECFE